MKQSKTLLDGWLLDVRMQIYVNHAILGQEKIHRGKDSLHGYYRRIGEVLRSQFEMENSQIMGLYNCLPMSDEAIEKGVV